QLHLWHEMLHLSMRTSFYMILITGVAFGTLAAALFGLLVGLPTLRLRGDYLAIATLGFGEILGEVIRNVDYLGSTRGISVAGDRNLWLASQPPPLPPLLADIQTYMAGTTRYVGFFEIFAGVVITIAIVRNFKYSTPGRAIFPLA